MRQVNEATLFDQIVYDLVHCFFAIEYRENLQLLGRVFSNKLTIQVHSVILHAIPLNHCQGIAKHSWVIFANLQLL